MGVCGWVSTSRSTCPWARAATSLSVPGAAVIARDGETTVMVVKHDGGRVVAKRVRVRTGRAAGGRREIVSDLRTGDEVIVSGAADLNDGDAINVIPTP